VKRRGPPWHQRLSLRSRMVLIAAGAVAVMVAVGGALIVLAVRAELIEAADDVGEARAEQIADLASTGRLPARLVAAEDLEAAVQVVRGGQVISTTENAAAAVFDLPEQPPDSDTVLALESLPIEDDGPFRVTAVGTQTPQGAATVFVAVEVEEINETIATVVGTGIVGLALLVVAESVLCWVVVGRTLAPVDAISRQAEMITGQRLDRRVPEPHADDEIRRLARTINDMLSRLEVSAMRQERFVADAAHELRSPLAYLRVRLEAALSARRDGVDAQLLPDLLTETVRLSDLVDELLLLARSDGGIGHAARPVDLDDVVIEVVSAIQGHDRVEVRLGTIQPVQLLGEAALLELVVRNLVENAIQHAASVVEVSLRAEGELAVLTVDDDGTGIPPHARQDVFNRFVRIDDGRSRARGGAGLGLAIVDEIVRLHSGKVEIADSPSGGARLCVQLPTG
jgi:signal transduction histidine kinase